MSKSDNTLRDELINTKDDKEYRHAYAEENLNATIATQIKVLREQRHWKQEELANEAEMKQPVVSRCENVNYSSWSINTLRKFAKAFDVYLDVRFRSFRELVESAETFSREALQVPAFNEDPYFRNREQDVNLNRQEKVQAILMSGTQLQNLLNMKILGLNQSHLSDPNRLSAKPESLTSRNSAANEANPAIRGSTPSSNSALHEAAEAL